MSSVGKVDKSSVALAVGIYDTAMGLWPLLSMGSFEKITGLSQPFIVRTLGASWAALGIALLISSKKRRAIPPLGVASTVAGSSLAFTQCVLVATKTISPIFLIQALAETVIGLTWIFTLARDDGESDAEQASVHEAREAHEAR